MLLSVNLVHEKGFCLNNISADAFSLPEEHENEEGQTQDAGMLFVTLDDLAGAIVKTPDGVKADLAQVGDILMMLLSAPKEEM